MIGKGTRATSVTVNKDAFNATDDELPDELQVYYNGGGVFVDAKDHDSVQVLADYADELNVESGNGKAAVVYTKVGDGAAILTGPHPE